MPFDGPEVAATWLQFLDLYAKLQREVDRHIGRVLRTLESRPQVAANTVVVFTSDHGEYGASHGLRGKGASAYEEAIRVPLIVKDPRGVLTSARGVPRTQLSSSVDVAPLLLTIATGSNQWRREPHYSHLAAPSRPRAHPRRPQRARAPVRAARDRRDRDRVRDRALRRRRPAARGRAAHAVGEVRHVHALGRRHASHRSRTPRKRSCTTTRTHSGRLELHNDAGQSSLEEALRAEYQRAFVEELRRPLPHRLSAAHDRGFADYFSTARRASTAATARRKLRSERDVGKIPPRGGPPERPAATSLRARISPSPLTRHR